MPWPGLRYQALALLRALNRLSHPGYGLRHPNCRFGACSSGSNVFSSDTHLPSRITVPEGAGFFTGDRQKAPEIAPLFKAFQRAGPRPENSFLYLLGHI